MCLTTTWKAHDGFIVKPLIPTTPRDSIDPEDLTRLDVFWEGRPVGHAIPFIIGRHVHRQVPQAQAPAPAASTGVDYLGLVVAEHDGHLLGHIASRDLPRMTAQEPRS